MIEPNLDILYILEKLEREYSDVTKEDIINYFSEVFFKADGGLTVEQNNLYNRGIQKLITEGKIKMVTMGGYCYLTKLGQQVIDNSRKHEIIT